MLVVVPIFLRADFSRMYYYLKKKLRARAVKKVHSTFSRLKVYSLILGVDIQAGISASVMRYPPTGFQDVTSLLISWASICIHLGVDFSVSLVLVALGARG